MSKKYKSSKQRALVRKRVIIAAAIVLAVLIALTIAKPLQGAYSDAFREKAKLLEKYVLTDEIRSQSSIEAGCVVFFSVSDGTSRAKVYSAREGDLDRAWGAAVKKTATALKRTGTKPLYVKADVVILAERVDEKTLKKRVVASRHEFFRYGLAFDEKFDTALLEAELNGAKIYEYDDGGVDLSYLNSYLKKADRPQLAKLPDEYILFTSRGWFVDEDDTVYPLIYEGLDYGRRDFELLDADCVRGFIDSASAFLVDQLKDDGSFVYGMYPRFDNDIANYNIVRHASTLWSLVCRYRMSPDESLLKRIDGAIDFMLENVIYSDDDTAYLYEEKSDEIKLGGCGVAVVALTEYMDVVGSDKYTDICKKLGGGILTMLDQSSGEYIHVLDGNFDFKEEFRTVYYDGEATFALARLYSLTGEQKWLDAIESAADHFIEANYAQYKDHWIAYSMNEITKSLTDREDYYAFGLKNAADNLEIIRKRDTTYHTYLELLMASFELYDRALQNGVDTGDFDVNALLRTIYTRVNRQLDGFFFPEYAMYMQNPARVLGSFMVRHDGYRIRIDDVQHNIGGMYLYWKNYDKLVEYGLLDNIDGIE